MTPTIGRPDCHGTDQAPSLITVAGKGTAKRTIRVDPELWSEFAAAAEQAGSDRSALIRDFIEWVLRKPDATPPRQIVDQIDKDC
jgi:hypothetical protein